MAIGSTSMSARIWAAAIGCVTYGSPEARFWSPWASMANAIARSIEAMSAFGSSLRTVSSRAAEASATGSDGTAWRPLPVDGASGVVARRAVARGRRTADSDFVRGATIAKSLTRGESHLGQELLGHLAVVP